MLRGNHPATVDAKGRLKIPAAFLSEMGKQGDEFYVTSEDGSRAKVYPMSEWERVEEKLAKLPSYNPTKRKFLNRTSYYGQVVTADGQGRILIPAVLRESADLMGEVDVLGDLTHLEVWNHNRYVDQEVRGKPWTVDDEKNLGDLGI